MFTATLTAVVCVIFQCCRGYDAIGQWLSEQPLDFLHTLGFLRTPPTASGLRKLLSRIDVTTLEGSLTRWINDLLANETPPADLALMALDHKSLRGTWSRFDRAVLAKAHPLMRGGRPTRLAASDSSSAFPRFRVL